jgi:nitric oxide reductase large subunit
MPTCFDYLRDWFRRNWQMPLIAAVGIWVAVMAGRTQNWLLGIAAVALAIGTAMNVLVMLANQGKMPVFTDDELLDQPDHHRWTAKTRLSWLSDWIQCGEWLLSPGDVVCYAGFFFIILNWIARITRLWNV